jgi:lipoprotein-anchoring transpeptidase ErfK/SrfK
MRQRSFILVAVVVAVLIAGAVAVYAYDSSRDDLIAKGVTVAGVDVGGMRTPEARRVVRRQVAARLERPLAVKYKHLRFRLSAGKAGLRADVDGMVDDALHESRSGFILARVARDVTGGEESAQVPARLSYSRHEIERLVKRVERRLNHPPRNATLNFPSLSKIKERNGASVLDAALRRRIHRTLTVPAVSRRVRAPVRITRPRVTRAELASRYPKLIVIDRGAFQLRFYRRLRLARAYPIAVGQQGLETPAGLHHIQDKQVNPSWHVPNSSWAGSLAGRVIPPGPDDPIKARWMGIIDGSGIHGTDEVGSLGSAASHGCIRMSIPDVEELYEKVAVGTPVYVA